MLSEFISDRDHFLRRLYRDRLSQFAFSKSVKSFVVKQVLPRTRSADGSQYKMMGLAKFSAEHAINAQEFIAPHLESVPSCKFYGPKRFSPSSTATSYTAPGSTLYEVKNATVLANSDFLFKNGCLVHPDSFDVREHISTVEQQNFGRVDPSQCAAKVPAYPKAVLERGINLLGDGAGNYAHFLTEIIPRLIAIDSRDAHLDYPLIVDGWNGEKLQRILLFFNSNCREIIGLDRWDAVAVNKLVHVSSPTYAPQDFRANFNQSGNISPIPNGSYKFNSVALKMVRDYAIRKCHALGYKPKKYKRIYLVRKPVFKDGIQYNLRHIANDHEAMHMFAKHDFKMVDVTSMSFEAQVMLFSEAEVIAGPLGASLASAIFAPEWSTVIGLAAYYENADYSYFANMMAALGHNLKYVLGSQYNDLATHPMHRKYYVCLDSLGAALADIAATQ